MSTRNGMLEIATSTKHAWPLTQAHALRSICNDNDYWYRQSAHLHLVMALKALKGIIYKATKGLVRPFFLACFYCRCGRSASALETKAADSWSRPYKAPYKGLMPNTRTSFSLALRALNTLPEPGATCSLTFKGLYSPYVPLYAF